MTDDQKKEARLLIFPKIPRAVKGPLSILDKEVRKGRNGPSIWNYCKTMIVFSRPPTFYSLPSLLSLLALLPFFLGSPSFCLLSLPPSFSSFCFLLLLLLLVLLLLLLSSCSVQLSLLLVECLSPACCSCLLHWTDECSTTTLHCPKLFALWFSMPNGKGG